MISLLLRFMLMSVSLYLMLIKSLMKMVHLFVLTWSPLLMCDMVDHFFIEERKLRQITPSLIT